MRIVHWLVHHYAAAAQEIIHNLHSLRISPSTGIKRTWLSACLSIATRNRRVRDPLPIDQIVNCNSWESDSPPPLFGELLNYTEYSADLRHRHTRGESLLNGPSTS